MQAVYQQLYDVVSAVPANASNEAMRDALMQVGNTILNNPAMEPPMQIMAMMTNGALGAIADINVAGADIMLRDYLAKYKEGFEQRGAVNQGPQPDQDVNMAVDGGRKRRRGKKSKKVKKSRRITRRR